MNEKPIVLDAADDTAAFALREELSRKQLETIYPGPPPAMAPRQRVSMLDVTSAVVAGMATVDMTPEQAAGAAEEKMETAGLNRKQRRRRGYIKRREARKEKTVKAKKGKR